MTIFVIHNVIHNTKLWPFVIHNFLRKIIIFWNLPKITLRRTLRDKRPFPLHERSWFRTTLLNFKETRMHSSGMCTARSSSCWEGGCLASSPQLPSWVWAWTRSPSTYPLVVGLDQIPPQLPPWLWAWRPPWDQAPPWDQTPQDQALPRDQTRPDPPGTRHPPVDIILDTCFWKYYLVPNFVCER